MNEVAEFCTKLTILADQQEAVIVNGGLITEITKILPLHCVVKAVILETIANKRSGSRLQRPSWAITHFGCYYPRHSVMSHGQRIEKGVMLKQFLFGANNPNLSYDNVQQSYVQAVDSITSDWHFIEKIKKSGSQDEYQFEKKHDFSRYGSGDLFGFLTHEFGVNRNVRHEAYEGGNPRIELFVKENAIDDFFDKFNLKIVNRDKLDEAIRSKVFLYC
jgi:hypothetical protein